MKRYIRALGVDDSYFVPHRPGKVPLVGAVLRMPNYFEGVLLREIEVDGLNSTEAIIDMLQSKYKKQIRIIFTQGITFGGFNVVDLERVHRETGVPVVVISRKEPNLGKIEEALKKHFNDWKDRMNLIRKYPLERVKNGNFHIYIQRVGISEKEALFAIKNFTVKGAIPEPLRVAHLIASALHFGESRGKP